MNPLQPLGQVIDTLPDLALANLLQRMAGDQDNNEEFVEVKLEQEQAEEEEPWEYEEDWFGEWDSNESGAEEPLPPPPPPLDSMPPPPPPPPPQQDQGAKGKSKNSKSTTRPNSPKGKSSTGKGFKGKKGWTEPTTRAYETARWYNRQIYKGDGRGGLYVRGGFVDKSGYFHQ